MKVSRQSLRSRDSAEVLTKVLYLIKDLALDHGSGGLSLKCHVFEPLALIWWR